jgi:hypothetical protein
LQKAIWDYMDFCDAGYFAETEEGRKTSERQKKEG